MHRFLARVALLTLLVAGCAVTRAQPYSQKDFLGLNMGVGLGLSVDTGGRKDRIESATVVNGIVRAEDERQAFARIVLESHYFFRPKRRFFLGDVAPENWGHGPFLVIQPGDREIVNAIGFGWMLGFRREGGDATRDSWNVGYGVIVDPNARVLGDGLKKNEPLPAGETMVRYKTEAESSVILVFSFTF